MSLYSYLVIRDLPSKFSQKRNAYIFFLPYVYLNNDKTDIVSGLY